MLLLLHGVEGVLWVRRSATVFRRRLRDYHLASTDGPFGNATHTFLLLSPLPPLAEMFVVEPWPLVLGEERVWVLSAEGGAAEPPAERTAPEVAQAHSEAKAVHAKGLLTQTSSAVLASGLAELLRGWAALPVAERASFTRSALEARFDRRALAARLTLLSQQTRRLAIVGNLFPLILFGGLWAFFFLPGAAERWPVLLATLLLVLLFVWAETFLVHRRLYPKERGDRAMKMFMLVFSFPAAARAQAWLARDALADYHPLAVASVLLSGPRLETVARSFWLSLQHPLGTAPEGAAADLSAARGHLSEAYRRILTEVGIDPAELERPPAPSNASARSYCPRCLEEYVEPSGPCPDCQSVERRSFGAGAGASGGS